MTNTVQLSEKVTPQKLDVMYSNFIKMTDWVIKGKQSAHKMPPAYAALFGAVDKLETYQTIIDEQSEVIGTLQQRLVQQAGKIDVLEQSLTAMNQTLTQLVELVNQQTAQIAPPVVQIEPTHDTPPVVQIEPELVDLAEVTTQTSVVSPNEEALKVSAEAVDAGNLDPASYAALDAEIASLVGGLS